MFNAAIDIEAAAAGGVRVCGTRGIQPPTTELTWALILACVKGVPANDAAVRSGAWQVTLGGDLRGARLGLVGLGNYGASVAAIGKAFGMDVVAWSQNLTPARCDDVGVAPVSKAELLSTSDVISIHLVLSDRTRGLIGAPELGAMKPTAYIVNTSRGPIIDETALVAALSDHRIAGAGLDAFDVEPLPLAHPLRRLDNVVLSPHMGYVTVNSYRVFFGDVIADIDAFLRGEVLRPVRPAP
jgi:phosphoglycerate dehydrogenase-like enzyme